MSQNSFGLRFPIIICALLLLFESFGQGTHYTYSFTLLDDQRSLSGEAEILFTNTSGVPLDTVFLHLPPRSLEYKGSFLNRQLAEFQNTDLHYADREETGYITINNLQVGKVIFPVCQDCEFVKIPLNTSLQPGDSIDLFFEFYIKMGNAEFNGIGYDGSTYRLIDWLPSIPTLDSSGFKLYPITFQMDVFPSYAQYDVFFTLPGDMLVASNASLHTQSEIALMDSLRQKPFQKTETSAKSKTLHFNHYGTNLQFLVSRNFYLFPISNGGTLFTLRENPLFPSIINKLHDENSTFFKKELDTALADYDLVLLGNKITEYQSDHLLTLEVPKNAFKLSSELALARAEMLFRYRLTPDGMKNVWLARGLPYYYKYQFISDFYPEEKWLPLSNTFIGRFFALDAFDYSYQNQFLYLYLARQGLDQKIDAPADSLTRLNYEAIAQAKTYLAFSHLRAYVTPINFKRAMRKFHLENLEKHAFPASLQKSMAYYNNSDISWFFEDWVHSDGSYNYTLKNTDYCPTISTATVKNSGSLNFPFSLTGVKDGKPVLTQWYEGHEGTKSVQMYHADYDKVVLNYHQSVPEHNQKDNTYYNRFLFQRMEPLRLQFYYSFEDPDRSQLYWTPTIGFNAYDKVLLGVSLDNSSIVQKPFEYIIGPDFSTGTGKLTGYSSFIYNYIPQNNSVFHQISAGIYGRYYHYDRDLTYLRISPALNFYFRKPYPRSSILQRLKVRVVNLDRELPADYDRPPNEVGNSSYSVLNINHRYQQTDIFRPYTLEADFLWGDHFSKLSLEGDLRWMMPNKKWFIWRSYGAYFFSNKFYNEGIENSYYSLGLSGTKDFLFDYPFFGRSDEDGIWSKQFFITEGGFKSYTGVYADEWMLTSNLSVPIWSVFGVFADIGVADNMDQVYYDFGFRLSLLTDFLEVYFPIVNHNHHFLKEANYLPNIRFMLDIDQGNIINRLRRGYY